MARVVLRLIMEDHALREYHWKYPECRCVQSVRVISLFQHSGLINRSNQLQQSVRVFKANTVTKNCIQGHEIVERFISVARTSMVLPPKPKR